MRAARLIVIGATLAIGAGALPAREAVPDVGPGTLRPVTAFQSIQDPRARSVALFREMGKVIQSPRCLNCHPRGDRPTQTDAMLPHNPPVLRGAAGMGVPGLACATCHGATNATFASQKGSVPGDPHWQLAPLEMAWQGRTLGQICRQVTDPKRNGGRTTEQLVEHIGDDHLVGWAWHPGPGRTPAPGTQAEMKALVRAWVDSGAHCPV